MAEYNSSGERLYRDEKNIKRNIRGMIRFCPEWVAARFTMMEMQVESYRKVCDEVNDGLESALGEIEKTRKYRWYEEE